MKALFMAWRAWLARRRAARRVRENRKGRAWAFDRLCDGIEPATVRRMIEARVPPWSDFAYGAHHVVDGWIAADRSKRRLQWVRSCKQSV